MFRLLNWWREYQLEKLRLKQQIATAPYQAIQHTVDRLVQAAEANTAVLKAWMDSFSMQTNTASTTMRDDDEVRAELERLGFERPELHETLNNAMKTGSLPDLKALIAGLE